MASKEPGGPPPGPGGEVGEADDVGAILDDMDEALEENPEEVIRSFRQEGGQ
ncbi:MAG: ubiquitin-like protein Pup [Streptosporangiaceae bacterium]